MMMPANFSAIAENEMTYVVGGGIEAYLAPAMTAENWKTFNTNLITIIGNTAMSEFLGLTVGAIFNGSYVPGNVVGGIWNNLKSIYGGMAGTVNSDCTGWANFANGALGVLNAGLYLVKGAAAVYTLGHGDALSWHDNDILTFEA